MKIKEFIQMMRDADIKESLDSQRLPHEGKLVNKFNDVKKNVI